MSNYQEVPVSEKALEQQTLFYCVGCDQYVRHSYTEPTVNPLTKDGELYYHQTEGGEQCGHLVVLSVDRKLDVLNFRITGLVEAVANLSMAVLSLGEIMGTHKITTETLLDTAKKKPN